MRREMRVINEMETTIPRMQRDERTANERACAAVGLQLLNFCANGSPNEPVRPPIRSGYLRGSGSVLVNGKFISATPSVNGLGNPVRSLSISGPTGQTIIDIIYNTEYAARWHENPFVPGGVRPSKAAKNNPAITTNVGNKWIEKHLMADGQDLLWLYGQRMMKEFFKGNARG